MPFRANEPIRNSTLCRFLLPLLVGWIAAVEATAVAGWTVTLAWERSASPTATEYRLYYGPTSGVYTNVILVGDVTSATVGNLEAGGDYFFTVTACESSGLESLPSNEVSYTVENHVILATRIQEENGVPVAVVVSATGAVPDRWTLEASSDLETWTVLTRGTNVPASQIVEIGDVPAQFFRLKAD